MFNDSIANKQMQRNLLTAQFFSISSVEGAKTQDCLDNKLNQHMRWCDQRHHFEQMQRNPSQLRKYPRFEDKDRLEPPWNC